jgi:Poxvirus D5 protein-like
VFADVEDLAVELNWSSENASKYIKAAQKLLREKLAEQGIKRTTADSIADNYQKYITSSDPVRAFYENRLYLDAGVTIPKDQLYQAYQDFCKENSLSPESEQSFSRTLTKEPYKLEYKWLKAADNGGEKKYHWIGVGIRGQQPTTDEYQSTIII